jgi:hypothetical protein
MISISDEIQTKLLAGYFGPAKVLDLNKDETYALLGIENGEEQIEAWGKITVSLPQELSFGDVVLAAGKDLDQIYIIGLLNSQSSGKKKIITENGSCVLIEKENASEKVRLFSAKNELIFEYEPSSGNSRINIESGDLEFITKKGEINFFSEGDINFKSKGSVRIESTNGIKISVKNFFEKIHSSILLDKAKIGLSSPNLNITSRKADVQIEAAKYIGSSFSAVIKHAKLIAGKFENIAGDIVSRARNVYETVEELTELRTGRVRMLVKSTLHFKSKNSYQISEEDYKVNAEKIHLG